MNVVIRTLVLEPDENRWRCSIGSGGAIVMLSDAVEEVKEMHLKLDSVLRVFNN
jgi:anthranilate/para-aminobenzoate synthase component I